MTLKYLSHWIHITTSVHVVQLQLKLRLYFNVPLTGNLVMIILLYQYDVVCRFGIALKILTYMCNNVSCMFLLHVFFKLIISHLGCVIIIWVYIRSCIHGWSWAAWRQSWIFKGYFQRFILYYYQICLLGTPLSSGSTRSSLCWNNKPCFRCSKN